MSNQPTSEIRGIHRLPLYGALAVVILALLLVIGSVISDGPVAKNLGESIEERSLYILDEQNGELAVYDARTKQSLGRFLRGEGAFVRISMRSLVRMRRLKEIDLNLPFKLVKSENGDLRITDPASGEDIRVNAFGPIAIESFAKFLPSNHSEEGAKG
ncbi:MAG: photosynthetic complex assembly protein PuhC [Rhizobiaceae bacterium]|nr:photosynthetic complex assembly protein PuhC [Rhizobiaceae bacterium]